MALQIYENALQQFLGKLSEVREYTDFVAASSSMRPLLSSAVDRNKLYGDGPAIMQAYFAAKCDSVKLSCNAAIIAVGSSFEEFIRRLLRDAINWINDSKRARGDIDEHLMNHNIVISGKVLATLFEPPADFAFDYDTLCVNLGTCGTETTTVVLNTQAFTFGVSGVNLSGIDRVLKRLGVEIDWDHIAVLPALQKHCNTKTTADTAKYIKQYLADFIISRNKIAHMGLGTVPSTIESNARMISFFELFAPKLAQVAEDRFTKRHALKKR